MKFWGTIVIAAMLVWAGAAYWAIQYNQAQDITSEGRVPPVPVETKMIWVSYLQEDLLTAKISIAKDKLMSHPKLSIDFGDGKSTGNCAPESTCLASPSHTYPGPGSYTAVLQDEYGAPLGSVSILFAEKKIPPAPKISVDATIDPIVAQGDNYFITGTTASNVSPILVIVSAISSAKYTGYTYLAEASASVVDGHWAVSIPKNMFTGFTAPYHVVVRTDTQILIEADVQVITGQ